MSRDNQVVPELSQLHCKDPHCSRQYHLPFLLLSGSVSTLRCSPIDLSCLRALHKQPSPCSTFHGYSYSIHLPNILSLVVCQSSSCVIYPDQDLLCKQTDNLLPFRATCDHRELLKKQHQAHQSICRPLLRKFPRSCSRLPIQGRLHCHHLYLDALGPCHQSVSREFGHTGHSELELVACPVRHPFTKL